MPRLSIRGLLKDGLEKGRIPIERTIDLEALEEGVSVEQQLGELLNEGWATFGSGDRSWERVRRSQDEPEIAYCIRWDTDAKGHRLPVCVDVVVPLPDIEEEAPLFVLEDDVVPEEPVKKVTGDVIDAKPPRKGPKGTRGVMTKGDVDRDGDIAMTKEEFES